MTTLLDVWRAVDPSATLVSGPPEALSRPMRGVARTRATPPHLPPDADGQLLVVDAAILPTDALDELLAALDEAAVEPAGIWLVAGERRPFEPAGRPIAIVRGIGSVTAVADAVNAYLESEAAHLASLATEIRLAGAEAALADPQPGAPAGVLASKLRRGVAVVDDGRLVALHPRPAGRALATRFAAIHARLLADRSATTSTARRTRDGLWLLERPVGPQASAWLFDDLPFARADEVGLDALAITLRALLRRRPAEPARGRREPTLPPSSGDPLRDTLLAVARANGRIAPAARALGVHRNTVLYRLRRASAELGIDPRRPDDALRLLRSTRTD